MVYVIEGNNGKQSVFKIGTTGQQVRERLRQIQNNNPLPLNLVAVLVGDKDDERMFHKAFDRFRLHGEWFSDCKGLRALINDFPVSVWDEDFEKLKYREMDIEEFYIKHTLLRFETPIIALNIARKNLQESEEKSGKK